jgi:hypothetical protein
MAIAIEAIAILMAALLTWLLRSPHAETTNIGGGPMKQRRGGIGPA